jgi:hypothetical protein
MTYHSIVGCVIKRPFEQVADAKRQVTHSMIARPGACARMRAQARGRAPAPLPARRGMALAPSSKIPPNSFETRYDKLTTPSKIPPSLFETRYDKLTTIMVECPERER